MTVYLSIVETVITSASNPTVKTLRRLATSAKARREANAYIAEGIHLAQALLATSHAMSLYVVAQSAARNEEVAKLMKRLDIKAVPRVIISDSLFESLTSLHAAIGLLVVFTPEQIEDNKNMPQADSYLLLEAVQDPGNLGTILRTAAAVGIQEVYLSPESASPWSPKALRAGMGAQFSLAIHEQADLSRIIEAASIPTYATSLAPDSRSLFAIDLGQPVAWLFGNEGQGVSKELEERASLQVKIPQADSSVESLNVAAAAAVCLYEQYRQNAQ